MDSGERELIHTALAGDTDSFELLMHAFGLRVYAVAYAILQDRPEAEDCAQDAFFKVWRARRQIREAEKFPAWLLTITRHAARDRLRRRAARPATVPLLFPDEHPAADLSPSHDSASAHADPFAHAHPHDGGGPDFPSDPAQAHASQEDEAERHQRVHFLLAGLPERHRLALTLRYLEGLDHQAIEQAMNLSNGALRGILSRALEAMRRGLRASTTKPAAITTALATVAAPASSRATL